LTGKTQVYSYSDQNRSGDHICYYSDLRKMKTHYPAWDITKSLETTISEIVTSWQRRQLPQRESTPTSPPCPRLA
jgi:CDP-paratose 2-epimerase